MQKWSRRGVGRWDGWGQGFGVYVEEMASLFRRRFLDCKNFSRC